MLSRTVSVGSRLKNWKTKPTCSRRTRVSSSSPIAERSRSLRRMRAAGRPIHRAAQVQQRRLAAAGRPHQRDEVAGLDLERDAGERGYPRVAGDIGFLEVLGNEDGHLLSYYDAREWTTAELAIVRLSGEGRISELRFGNHQTVGHSVDRQSSIRSSASIPVLASRGGTMLSGRLNAVPELHCRFCAGFSLVML